jgi:hypothetical protein
MRGCISLSPSNVLLFAHRVRLPRRPVAVVGNGKPRCPPYKLQTLHFSFLEEKPMQGIHFVVDDHHENIAVLIDLTKYGELWEDFYDGLIASEGTQRIFGRSSATVNSAREVNGP